MSEVAKFGTEIKHESFHLDQALTFVNHGSYGTVPRKVFAKKQKLQLEIESAPDKWFRYTSLKEWHHNKQLLADYLKVNTANLLICENATESINAALKSIQFNGSRDAILEMEYTYNAIANSVDYVAKYRMAEDDAVQVFKVPCKFPIKGKKRILFLFKWEWKQYLNFRISQNILFLLLRMIGLWRSENVHNQIENVYFQTVFFLIFIKKYVQW